MSDSRRQTPLVVGVGEILWDILPGGPALGGAPANFAWQARRLGARAAVISAIGADELGRQARRLLELQGVDHSAVVTVSSQPTGTVHVSVGAGGEPFYRIAEPVAWDVIPRTAEAVALASSADAICYGTLALRRTVSRATILAVIDATSRSCFRVFDVNLRTPWIDPEVIATLLQRSNVVKLNESELDALTGILDLGGDETERIEQLASRFPLRLVALTRGSSGCRLFADGRHVVHPGFPLPEVVDTVGAGDAFTAALVLGLCDDLPLTSIAETSNRVASGVCTQSGASAAGTTSIGRVS